MVVQNGILESNNIWGKGSRRILGQEGIFIPLSLLPYTSKLDFSEPVPAELIIYDLSSRPVHINWGTGGRREER